MLTGRVTESREASVPITVIGPAGERVVSVVVDTGFNGFLTLPTAVIQSLRLEFANRALAELADGSVVSLARYHAEVRLGLASAPVLILESDGGALMGMALLEGSIVTIEVWNSGRVTIAPRPQQGPPR